MSVYVSPDASSEGASSEGGDNFPEWTPALQRWMKAFGERNSAYVYVLTQTHDEAELLNIRRVLEGEKALARLREEEFSLSHNFIKLMKTLKWRKALPETIRAQFENRFAPDVNERCKIKQEKVSEPTYYDVIYYFSNKCAKEVLRNRRRAKERVQAKKA